MYGVTPTSEPASTALGIIIVILFVVWLIGYIIDN